MNEGRKKLVVLSSIMPRFDSAQVAAMLAPVVGLDVDLVILDPLAPLALDDAPASVADLAEALGPMLLALKPTACLGLAFGGAVLQHMASQPWWGARPLALISSPTHVQGRLAERLREIIVLIEAGDVAAGLALLEWRVQPEAKSTRSEAKPLPITVPGAGDRVCRGLRLLLGHNGLPALTRTKSPVLAIAGAASQLVTTADATPAPGQRLVTIIGAGMRPLSDIPETTASLLNDFLWANLP